MEHNFVDENLQLSDFEIVTLIKGGDYHKLQVLINRYMPYIISVATKQKALGLDVEDLIGEGIIAVFNAVKSFDSEKSSFRTFVTMCINRAINDQLRLALAGKRIPENLITNIEDAVLLDESNPENILIEKENYNDLTQTIRESLSAFEYDVFSAFLRGDSYVDIAAALNVSVKSVDNALRRIRNKLRH